MLTPRGFLIPAKFCLTPSMPGMLKGRPAAAMDMFCWRLMPDPRVERLLGGTLGSVFSGDERDSSSVVTWAQEDMCAGQ